MTKTRPFLLEIATEPLPARFIPQALEDLRSKAEVLLKENRLGFSGLSAMGTLRRLALVAEALDEKSPPLTEDVLGPPARLWKNEDGSFTPQAEGFARRQGVDPAELTIADTPKGPMLAARKSHPGEAAAAILKRVLPGLVSSLNFPKSMEWEESRLRFARPIRGLTCLHGSQPIAFSVAGIKSAKKIAGLPGRPLAAIAEAGRYEGALKNLSVIVDPAKRREMVLKRLQDAAKSAGGQADMDEDLVQETVFMTEHPTCVVCHFKGEFLQLPKALLSTVLKKQQRFFPLAGKGGGLLPSFIAVRDGSSEGLKEIREGYERVVTARLTDAEFFLGRDLKSRLEDKLPLLKNVMDQKELGSLADKAGRVESLTSWICEALRENLPMDEGAASQIARLAYADLVCGVVKEFPNLQGSMGGTYARREGLPEKVALGLEEFYAPLGPRASLPATLEGAVASLAGKLDSLAGHFALGHVPTGSLDPFALRRQALGSLRICLEKQLPLDLGEALAKALSFQPLKLDEEKSRAVRESLEEFLWSRAESLLGDMGYLIDEIRSVRRGALANLPRTLLRLSAVHVLRKEPDFEPLAGAFKRAANILKQARVSVDGVQAPQRASLREPAELALHDALAAAEGQALEKISQARYQEGLKSLVGLKPQVDTFFEQVMVMAEDPALKQARLGLLAQLVRVFYSVADLAEIAAAPAPASASVRP